LDNLNEQNELQLLLMIIIAFIAIAVLISFIFIHPRMRSQILAFDGVVGPFFGIPAVLFSLMAALFATTIWDNYNIGARAIRTESQGLINLISLANTIPALQKGKIAEYAQDYARSVIQDEWQSLSLNQASSPKTSAHFSQLRDELFRSGDLLNKTEFQALIDTYLRVNLARETRLSIVSFDIHPARWFAVLFLGFLVQIAVAFVHLSKPKALIAAMTIATTTVLIPICMITLTFSTPFSGMISISNTPYLQVVN
jgi:hypothetical protein